MSSCFVMMPFGGYCDGYYSDVIRPAVAGAGLVPVRADEIYGAGAIVDDIYRAILSSDVCIADVSHRNPNVSYELGMAHGAFKPVVLITQDVKDVPFDYRHLRIITYDPKAIGWERRFADVLRQTISEVRRSPDTAHALKAVPGDLDKVRQHLRAVFLATAYDLDRTNWLYCDENGHTLIKTSWKVQARSPVFHLCHNIVTDRPGRIEVRRAHDKLSARDLEWIKLEQGPKHLSYFFLFKQFKQPGQHFEALTEVYAEHYFDFEVLFATGETMMSSQAFDGGMRFTRRTDWLYLPKTAAFSRVFAEYQSHPDPALVGSRVDALDHKDHWVLRMTYDPGAPHQQETAARLRLA